MKKKQKSKLPEQKGYRIVPVDSQPVAKIGKFTLFENVIRIVKTSPRKIKQRYLQLGDGKSAPEKIFTEPTKIKNLDVQYDHLAPNLGQLVSSNAPTYHTTREASHRSGIPQKSIERWCRDGKVDCYKSGKFWQVNLVSLREYQKKQFELDTLKRQNGFYEVGEIVNEKYCQRAPKPQPMRQHA